jgi:hypothetical protein
MNWGEAALWWLPTAAVAAMTVLGLVVAVAQPGRRGRKYLIAAVLLFGVLAIGASAWQQHTSRNALGGDSAHLRELRARLDEVARLLPAGPGATPAETFDRIAAALVVLNKRITDLETQTRALEEKSRARTIDPDTAEKMAESLRGSGGHRVVVSCVPDDVEAYTYANQIANVLRAAGWEALGPQTTTIFGAAPAMGVTLYVRGGGAPPEAAKLVLAAFARFNIPYRSGITPSPAIPDPETVELFVGRKP